jgi:hypothetical protein
MCNPYLPLVSTDGKDSRVCITSCEESYEEFKVYYKATTKLAIGVTCNSLRHINEFVTNPNYTISRWAVLRSEYPGIYINRKSLIFKDGKSMCFHCKNYLKKLRGSCSEYCEPKIVYL